MKMASRRPSPQQQSQVQGELEHQANSEEARATQDAKDKEEEARKQAEARNEEQARQLAAKARKEEQAKLVQQRPGRRNRRS